jgi:hypothetical protein
MGMGMGWVYDMMTYQLASTTAKIGGTIDFVSRGRGGKGRGVMGIN